MSDEKYVPQVGDVVDSYGGYGNDRGGVYIGEQTSRGSGRHVILGEDGKNCTVVQDMRIPSSALALDGGSVGYYSRAAELANEGARLLALICEDLEEVPVPAPRAPTYRTPAGAAVRMSAELVAWWKKARLQMAKVSFVDSCIKIRDARQACATIVHLGGLPSIEMQERVEAAEHELAARRARVLYVFADQIAAARKEYKIEDAP